MGAQERVRAAGIVNASDAMRLAAGYDGPDIVLSYTAADNGRGGRGAYWSVWSPSHKTHPRGHWSDHGHKAFSVFGPGKHSTVKAETEATARAWAAERYGVTEWAKVPGVYGAPWLPAAAADVIQRLVREAALRGGPA